jgi:hypothetical protein
VPANGALERTKPRPASRRRQSFSPATLQRNSGVRERSTYEVRTLALTLWRGERPLGEIHLRAPIAAGQLDGVLLPAADHPPLASLWQVRVPPPFGDAVMEQALEPDVVAERGQRGTPANSGPVALAPVGPGEAPGVPAADRLQVRDAAGAALPVTLVMMLEHRPDPAAPSPELAALPPGALVGGCVWLVTARVDANALSGRVDR